MSEEEILDRIDAWHKGAGKGMTLSVYLGWTWEQYKEYIEKGTVPSNED